MSSDRNLKYQRHGHKGAAGEATATSFLNFMGIPSDPVEGEENYSQGDLRIRDSGRTIEVKSQKIRPHYIDAQGVNHRIAGAVSYPANFIEVCEVNTRQDQLAQLASCFHLEGEALARLQVLDARELKHLTTYRGISFSLEGLSSSVAFIYCNNEAQPDGRHYLCIYASSDLNTQVRKLMVSGGLRRMPGKRDGSNEDTIGVFAPWPPTHFWFSSDAERSTWNWCGQSGSPKVATDELFRILGVAPK